MAGNLIARAIVEGNAGWKHFEPFELIWAGGRMGRAAAKIGYLAYTLRHEFEAYLSRRRESGRGRKEIADARRAERAWSRLVNEPEKPAGKGVSIVQRLRASPIGQKIAATARRPSGKDSGKDNVNKTAV
jgi:2Fe-2S ferredoxin